MTGQTTDPVALHPAAFPADGALPAPFTALACLRVCDSTSFPAGPVLLHAWEALACADGELLAGGSLRALPAGLPSLSRQAGEGVAGLACALGVGIAAGTHGELPRVLSPGIDLRLLAGRGFEREAPVLAEVPCALAVLRLARMMRFEFRPEYPGRAVAVAAGTVQIEGQALEAGAMLAIPHGKTLYIDALAASVLVLCAGQV